MMLDGTVLLDWVPKFTYADCGVPVTFTLRIPMRAWLPSLTVQGGWDESTSGVQEAFRLRDDYALDLVLRFTEEEWHASVAPMFAILHAQPQAFTLQLDALDAGTINTVRLVSPVTGDKIRPDFNQFDGVLELPIVVRTSDGTAFAGTPYFPSLA